MTLLTVIQEVCEEIGLTVPASVVGSTDKQVIQLRRILEKEGLDLAKRHAWQVLIREATHTSLAAASQGAITSIASGGYEYMLPETFWDRTNDLQITGPLDDKDWQALQAGSNAATHYSYRIRGGLLLIYPTPSAGLSWAFEYKSHYWIQSQDGSTYRKRFSNDQDVILLPEELVQQGAIWRWKKEKGLEYAEDFTTYERMVSKALGMDGGKKTLNMGGYAKEPFRGLFIATPYIP